jgi:hypothetical protein
MRSRTRPRTGSRCWRTSSVIGLRRAAPSPDGGAISRAAAAIDILAAAPLLSATSLGQVLGMATKNATRLLEGFIRIGIASEVTHRSKRRLYGLKHLAPLREVAAAPPSARPPPGPAEQSAVPYE